jgi:signal transduction histidine kinase
LIKDNGRGIEDADKAKVFQAFRRARNTSDIRGLGMGMAFVQSTVRKLGGTIWFDSKRGVGTSFYFTIPVIQAQGAKAA